MYTIKFNFFKKETLKECFIKVITLFCLYKVQHMLHQIKESHWSPLTEQRVKPKCISRQYDDFQALFIFKPFRESSGLQIVCLC